MFGKLYHTIAVVSIAITLAGGALLGLLYGTGKLTPERIEQIAELLRAEAKNPANAETDAEAEGTEPQESAVAKSASAEELRQQRRDVQLARALGERAHRDRIAQRELLDRALQDLIQRQERFEQNKATWQNELARRQGAARDAGFEKELAYVSQIPAKQAKTHLILKWKERPADAVRLLNALSPSKGKRILEQMKTPEEMQIMHELLEQLGQQSVDESP